GRQRLPPRADETTNFSSGPSRHAIAGLVFSAPVRCQRFARQQRKPRGARNFAYFIAAGEAVALLLQLIMFLTVIDWFRVRPCIPPKLDDSVSCYWISSVLFVAW